MDQKILDDLIKDVDRIVDEFKSKVAVLTPNVPVDVAKDPISTSPSSSSFATSKSVTPDAPIKSDITPPKDVAPEKRGLHKLPLGHVAYDSDKVGGTPPRVPMKAPRWRDTWRWEGPVGLIKRGLFTGVDPYGKAAVHAQESTIPSLDEYRHMKKFVNDLVETSFQIVPLLEEESPLNILVADLKKDLQKTIQSFFVTHYNKIQKSETAKTQTEKAKTKAVATELKKLQDEVAKIKSRLEIRKKKALKKLVELRSKRAQAKTPAAKENVTNQINATQNATQELVDIGNQQLMGVMDNLTPERITEIARIMKADNNIPIGKTREFFNAYVRSNGKMEVPSDILTASREEIQACIDKANEVFGPPRRGRRPEVNTAGAAAAGAAAAGAAAAATAATAATGGGGGVEEGVEEDNAAESLYVRKYNGE